MPQFTNFLGSVTYSLAGYVPQIVAIWTGRSLGVSVEAILRLGRVLNAATTIALFYAAFRALPVGHYLLLVISILPMTAACAGSFGQDGLIIGGSVLLAALSVRAVAYGRWTRRQAIVAGLLTCALTLAKIVYLPLGGLALLPRLKDTVFWRWALLPVTFAVIAMIVLAIWLHSVSGLIVPAKPGIPWPSVQLAEIIHHPLRFP